jgi:hypothetical protein
VDTEYDDEVVVEGDSLRQTNATRGAQVIQIDSGKHVSAVALCAALCGLSAALSVWAAFTAMHAEKRTELTNYYLMDPHSRTPEELASWAKFNKEHEEK